MDLKNIRRGRMKEYTDEFGGEYWDGKRPWGAKCDVTLPSATQNEINKEDAQTLVKNGCICVAEGANMPSEAEAINVFLENKILFGPGKAANAGGVAVSGLEMSQNAMSIRWSREEVDKKLHQLCKRRQYCRIYKSRRRNDGSGGGLIINYKLLIIFVMSF